jgi:hypothetical protein
MKKLRMGVALCAILASRLSLAADDQHVPGDRFPAHIYGGGDPCATDLFCSVHTLTAGFVADGEFDPVGQRSGFVTTETTIVVIDNLCGIVSEADITGPDFPGPGPVFPATRSFAWGMGAGDSWVGSWAVTNSLPKLYHLDSSFNTLNAFSFPDPGTGLDMQFSGLALDRDRGHLWGILRNNPAGTLSRFVELDVNVDPPVVIQGPIEVPWPGGASAVGSAGLEYNNTNCTILALQQDSNNVGQTFVVAFQDVDPAGPSSGVTRLGECQLTNTPCTGGGQSTNRPWGISYVEIEPAYLIFSDLNLQANCGTIDQPADFHLVEGPAVSGTCLTPVTPTTWGQIKASYGR